MYRTRPVSTPSISKRSIPSLAGILAVAALGPLVACELDEEMPDHLPPQALPGPVADFVGPDPVAFAPGIVPADGEVNALAAAPGSDRVYLEMSAGESGLSRIWVAHWDEAAEAYREPEPLHFSDGTHVDQNPALAPDGSALLFGSSRPTPDPAPVEYNLWGADRVAVGEYAEGQWAEPRPLPMVNSPAWDGAPTVAASGDLYFASEREATTAGPNLFVAEMGEDGTWATPEPMDVPVNSSARDTDPWVAPDESFLVFASDRGGPMDLWVSFRSDVGGWLDPLPLGEAVNSDADERAPAMTADGSYLFFHREGVGIMVLPVEETGIRMPDDL